MIHKDSDPMFHVQGESLHLNNVVNDLGVLRDDRMTFAGHVDSLVKKIDRGPVPSLKNTVLPDGACNKASCTLTRAHEQLNYCPAVWGALDKTLILELQKTVNFAARVIFDVRKYDDVTTFLKKLNG